MSAIIVFVFAQFSSAINNLNYSRESSQIRGKQQQLKIVKKRGGQQADNLYVHEKSYLSEHYVGF